MKATYAISLLLSSLSALADIHYASSIDELEDALWDVATEMRDYGAPGEVVMASGVYDLDKTLRIYPGTTLTLQPDTVIRAVMEDPQTCMLRGVHFDEDGWPCYGNSDCEHGGYGQTHDIVVQGGTWDCNCSGYQNSNIFILRHADNVVLRDVTFRRCSNHYVNLSGSRNVLVENATFCDPVLFTDDDPGFWGSATVGDPTRYGTLEALHLDFINPSAEGKGYPVDGTPCRDILVKDCIFSGVFSGVGTHHAPLDGDPYAEGIEIRGCVFEDLWSYAIHCFGYEGAVIADNVSDGGDGLVIGAESSGVVSGNDVRNGAEHAIYFKEGSAVSVVDNFIQNPENYGVLLRDCLPGTVSGNTVQATGSVGIRIDRSSGCVVSNNKVAGTASKCDGILLQECATGTVSGNKVSKTGGFGIRILGSSKTPSTVKVSGNTVSTGAAAAGYYDIKLGDYCRNCKVTGNALGNNRYAMSKTGTSGNVYQTPQYELSFNPNGGSGSMSAKTCKYGTKYALPANAFTRKGYTFAGWALDANGAVAYKNKATVLNLALEGTVKLFAVWKLNKYMVSFNANGGTGKMAAVSCEYGTTYALPANAFTRKGYSFAGWAKSAKGKAAYTNQQAVKNLVAANGGKIVLYAVWKLNSYYIDFNPNGGKGTMASMTCKYGTSYKLAAGKFSRTGYRFAGWSKTPTGAVAYKNGASVKSLSAKHKAHVVLYAVWSVNTYTVSFNANGGKGTMAGVKYKYGKAYALPKCAFSRKGYLFAGWSKTAKGEAFVGNGGNVQNLTKTHGATVKLYAVWKKPVSISFSANGGVGSMAAQKFPVGGYCKLPKCTMTRQNCTFAGWATTPGGPAVYVDGDTIVDVRKNLALHAVWEDAE